MTLSALRTALPDGQRGRPFIRTMLVYLPVRTVPALVGAVAMPALGWFLVPAEFAILALVTAGLPFITMVGDSIVSGYQRHAHRSDETEGQTAIWVILLGGAASALLAAAGLLSRQWALVGLALLAIPYMVIRVQWTKLQMTGRAGAYSLLQTVYTLGRGGCMVAAAALTHRAFVALAGWITVTFLTVVVGPRMRVDRVPRLSGLAGLARIGVPLVAASLAMNTAAITDRFVVAALQGRSAAGVYALGYVLTEGVLAIPASVAYLAFYRPVTQAWDEGREREALHGMAALLRVQVTFAIAGAAVVGLVGPAGIRLLAPAEYHAAASVLGLVAVAQVPAGIVPYLVLVATLRRQTVRVVVPSLVAAVASVAVTIPAVYFAGIMGAAAATLATYVLYALLLARGVFARIPGIAVVRLLLAAVAATAGMCVSQNLLVRAVLGTAAAALTAYALTRSWRTIQPRSTG